MVNFKKVDVSIKKVIFEGKNMKVFFIMSVYLIVNKGIYISFINIFLCVWFCDIYVKK